MAHSDRDSPGPADPKAHLRVLVVDDEPLVRQLMCSVLASNGFDVLEAADGPSALSLLGGGTVDLLVTDYQMPGMTGIELAAKLRAALVGLPVVVISGLPGAAQLASQNQFGFVGKPFRPDELMIHVRLAVAAESSLAGETAVEPA